MAQGKEHVRRKQYKMLDGTTVSYDKIVKRITKHLKKGDKKRASDITADLKLVPKELTHLLPYLAQTNEIEYMRTDSDVLLYYRRDVHIWFKTLYPAPKVNPKHIISITRHHSR